MQWNALTHQSNMNTEDKQVLQDIEEWTGHRKIVSWSNIEHTVVNCVMYLAIFFLIASAITIFYSIVTY